MARDIKVEGLPGLRAALAARAYLMEAAARAMVAAEVRTVEADASRLAPVDTGELKAGIEGSSEGTYGQVRAGTRHSPFLEFGTSSTAAQPFMAPAAESSRRRFVGRVALAVRKAVE